VNAVIDVNLMIRSQRNTQA